MANKKRPSEKKQQSQRRQQAQKQMQQQGPHLSEQWWQENQDILQYLYEEHPIPEIAQLVGQSEEEVKAVQEQLENLRTVELSSEDTMLILKYLPHPRHEYPPEALEEIERFWQRIDAEPLEDEDGEVIRDASSNLDKYIYG